MQILGHVPIVQATTDKRILSYLNKNIELAETEDVHDQLRREVNGRYNANDKPRSTKELPRPYTSKIITPRRGRLQRLIRGFGGLKVLLKEALGLSVFIVAVWAGFVMVAA